VTYLIHEVQEQELSRKGHQVRKLMGLLLRVALLGVLLGAVPGRTKNPPRDGSAAGSGERVYRGLDG
jgi:hypothetical protein